MSAKQQSSIPKVCQENWLQMSPTEKVRFCQLCQKNVFDFSEEVPSNPDEIVCLRQHENHLKTPKNKLLTSISNLFKQKE